MPLASSEFVFLGKSSTGQGTFDSAPGRGSFSSRPISKTVSPKAYGYENRSPALLGKSVEIGTLSRRSQPTYSAEGGSGGIWDG